MSTFSTEAVWSVGPTKLLLLQETLAPVGITIYQQNWELPAGATPVPTTSRSRTILRPWMRTSVSSTFTLSIIAAEGINDIELGFRNRNLGGKVVNHLTSCFTGFLALPLW